MSQTASTGPTLKDDPTPEVEVSAPENALVTIHRDIEARAPAFSKALNGQIAVERFVRAVQNAIQRNPELLDCNRDSLIQAIDDAAQDQLLPDNREGALIVRFHRRRARRLVTWQPMVAGLIGKAKRGGSVLTLSANLVRRGEHFRVIGGDEERIEHVVNIDLVDSGQIVAVYAIATLKNGLKEREWMTVRQIEEVRAMSTSPDTGAWVDWWDEMAKKTVLRRLYKRLPALEAGDEDVRRAIDRVDDLYEFGRKDNGPVIDGTAVPLDEDAILAAEEPNPEEEPEIGYIDVKHRFRVVKSVIQWQEEWRYRIKVLSLNKELPKLKAALARNRDTIRAVKRIDREAADTIVTEIRQALDKKTYFLPEPGEQHKVSPAAYFTWFRGVIGTVPDEVKEQFLLAQEEQIGNCLQSGDPWGDKLTAVLPMLDAADRMVLAYRPTKAASLPNGHDTSETALPAAGDPKPG